MTSGNEFFVTYGGFKGRFGSETLKNLWIESSNFEMSLCFEVLVIKFLFEKIRYLIFFLYLNAVDRFFVGFIVKISLLLWVLKNLKNTFLFKSFFENF